mgnify:FL=1
MKEMIVVQLQFGLHLVLQALQVRLVQLVQSVPSPQMYLTENVQIVRIFQLVQMESTTRPVGELQSAHTLAMALSQQLIRTLCAFPRVVSSWRTSEAQ